MTKSRSAAVCNRLLSSARKGGRENVKNAWMDSKGRCVMTDGFRAYRLNEKPTGLSEILTAKPATIQHFNLDPIFQPLDEGRADEMPTPDMDALRSFLKDHRKEDGPALFDLGSGLPVVNAVYLLDIMRLLPDAKWYLDPRQSSRLISTIYALSESGSACLMPVRTDKKPQEAPKASATPAKSIQRPETISAGEGSLKFDYFIYSRPAGESRYLLTDLQRGTVGLKAIAAPRYKEKDLEQIKEILDQFAAENPGASFQLRKLDGKKVVYTAIPTFTPEMFAETITA